MAARLLIRFHLKFSHKEVFFIKVTKYMRLKIASRNKIACNFNLLLNKKIQEYFDANRWNAMAEAQLIY